MHDEELSRRMMTLAADAERAARLASVWRPGSPRSSATRLRPELCQISGRRPHRWLRRHGRTSGRFPRI